VSELQLNLVLLPGLNGTTALFQEFIAALPAAIRAIPLSFPCQEALDYSALKTLVCRSLAQLPGPIILLGESFSGPLAIMVGEALPERVKGVVLVASFSRSPRSRWLSVLPIGSSFTLVRLLCPLVFRLFPRSGLAAICRELRQVPARVLAFRLREVLKVDVDHALARIAVPILYLRGSRDVLVPKSAVQHIRAEVSGVEVREYSCGHFLLQSVPAEAGREVAGFVFAVTGG